MYYLTSRLSHFVETSELSNNKVITSETIAVAFPSQWNVSLCECVNAELENHPIQAIAALADISIDKLDN